MSFSTAKILLAASALALTVTPALADKSNGKAKGKSAEHSQPSQSAKSAKSAGGNGALASELKGLNAAHASPTALANAAPNSQVGRIALYRDAALLTADKAAALDAANLALEGLAPPTRSVADIDAAIAGLDPLAEGYADALAALQQEKADAEAYGIAAGAAELAALELAAAQEAEEAALLSASDGRILSDAAIAYLRQLLDL